jgi:hypothetical protein
MTPTMPRHSRIAFAAIIAGSSRNAVAARSCRPPTVLCLTRPAHLNEASPMPALICCVISTASPTWSNGLFASKPRATMPAELTPGRAFLAERQAAAAAAAAGRHLASRLNAARAPSPVTGLLADATEDGIVRVTLLASAGTARTTIEAAWTMLAATMVGDSIAAGHRPAGPWPPYRFVALRHRLAADGARSAGEVIDDNAA